MARGSCFRLRRSTACAADLTAQEWSPPRASALGRHYEQIAQPFEWKFARQDLHRLLERIEQRTPELRLVA